MISLIHMEMSPITRNRPLTLVATLLSEEVHTMAISSLIRAREEVHTAAISSILPTRMEVHTTAMTRLIGAREEIHTGTLSRLVGGREARADKNYEREG